ncbi:helix-turn-helix domain-containing protein [Pseudoxanthomonas winnipegensis]|uniref:AraC family transcriptional regulator n=1 Tax=Pseudoxanthomonas winnipegensis TaxID=2480810 RepID=A0A4Q8LJX9_9GAMM|nr:AraC family transcriptional regulator [Pseudoxanthomonas winnipegensis]RZZ82598.1 AraC family transcriptional regulator [Pseudoxanthomonas winnipegensis]TAA30557.1 AraC family transcriptional regulator [Pseudoxanthomonas winnipegensis]
MDYAEHTPPPALRRYVDCLWELRDATPDAAIQTVYPDGRCELLAELGVPLRFHGADGQLRADQAFCFAAQQRGPIRLQATGPVHCIGVRLTAAASGLVAGERLPTLREQAPDLYTLDPAFAQRFAQATRASVSAGTQQPLWDLLQVYCAGFALDPLAEQAAALLDSAEGDLRMTALADRLGVSLRTLQARFLMAVGLTPKEYARVRRLQGLLRTLDGAASPIAEAAAQHGYSDQAHATHDLTRFTGMTPARLVRALRGDRDGADAIRLAAAFVRGHAGA